MRYKKEELKAEKKRIVSAIKKGLLESNKSISETMISDLNLESKLIFGGAIEKLFDEQKEMLYNKEFSKLQTVFKRCKESLGSGSFNAQYEYMQSKPDVQLQNRMFNYKETLRAMELVLKGQ